MLLTASSGDVCRVTLSKMRCPRVRLHSFAIRCELHSRCQPLLSALKLLCLRSVRLHYQMLRSSLVLYELRTIAMMQLLRGSYDSMPGWECFCLLTFVVDADYSRS